MSQTAAPHIQHGTPEGDRMNTSVEQKQDFWCVAGNIKRQISCGHGSLETKSGTRQFKGGAKVRIIGSFPGSCDGLVVIGQNKHTGKYIRTIVRVTAIENLRIKMMYGNAETALAKQAPPDGALMIKTKADAEQLERIIPEWCALWA